MSTQLPRHATGRYTRGHITPPQTHMHARLCTQRHLHQHPHGLPATSCGTSVSKHGSTRHTIALTRQLQHGRGRDLIIRRAGQAELRHLCDVEELALELPLRPRRHRLKPESTVGSASRRKSPLNFVRARGKSPLNFVRARGIAILQHREPFLWCECQTPHKRHALGGAMLSFLLLSGGAAGITESEARQIAGVCAVRACLLV